MRFTIARGELSESLTVASRGLSSRSTLPILSGILIRATDEGLVTLQTTDLEVSIKVEVAALVEQTGSAVLPGRLFSDIVKSMPEAAVGVSVEGDHAVVGAENSSFSLKTLKAEDFPRFPEVEPEKTVTLPSRDLAEVSRQVTKAVSRDETRMILTGVLLTIEGVSMRAVATDSYRLAVREIELKEPISETIDIVVPGRALEEVVRMAGGDSEVTLAHSDNQIVFSFDGTTFVTRRIEGAFPNWKQLIPKDIETTVALPAEEMRAAVKRVSLLAQHNSPVRIVVSAEDQTMSLSATTQDIGDASEDLMVKAEGKDVEIAFNHGFLLDGLAAVPGEDVELRIVSPLKPGLLSAPGDESFVYLLMPVRVG